MGNKNFRITWIPITNNPSRFIGVAECPGKYSKKCGSKRQLYCDLNSLKQQNVSVIISLISKIEIESFGIFNFEKILKEFGFTHYFEPIGDFSVPEGHQIKNINDLIKRILSLLKKNKTVLVHCNAGLGRSGMIVGLLVKLVGSINDPVAHVRNFRDGAIETKEQELFVKSFKFT